MDCFSAVCKAVGDLLSKRIFFLLVSVLLTIALWAKPIHTSKGAHVYRDTAIKNPTPEKAEVPANPSSLPYRVALCNISAYTASSDECGKNNGITASGVQAVAGRTIAMDGVPFGTEVEIEGHVYVVEDRFGGGYTDRIDVFMDTKAEAFRWGRRWLEVKIYEK